MEVVNTTTTTNPVNMYNVLNGYILNPIVFIIILLILISYYVFSSSLGNGESTGTNAFGIIIFIILIVLIVVNALQYFFSINVTAIVQGLFTPKTTIDIVVDQPVAATSVPEIRFKKQVFNIPGNLYSYDNADAVCKAYGAELATYDQIENAYNSGAEWCNYGWSANQLALFPTQKQTYNNLQKIQGHDITNKDIYETVISIIEMYEMEYLNKYMLDETCYNNIFKIIKTIRLTKEEFSLLETLIVIVS